MNISPIGYQTNFKGEFKRTEALDKAMEKASDYDLKKFGKILRRMQDVDDNMTYEVYSSVNERWARGFTSVYLRKEKSYKEPVDGVIKSYSDSKLTYEEWPETAYNGVLKKVNKILEEKYPEPEVTKADRQKSINYINRFLV